jgi:hypothetical protein
MSFIFSIFFVNINLRYNNHEYTITSGIINVKSDLKDKQVCLSIISTKLPTSIQIKAHE